MRKAAAVDANQGIIVDMFRRLGWSVQILSAVGEGMTDLLVGKHGLNLCVEVKDGDKIPSARKLTGPQEIWHSEWRGLKCVVEHVEHVIEIDRNTAEMRARITALNIEGHIGRRANAPQITRIPPLLTL